MTRRESQEGGGHVMAERGEARERKCRAAKVCVAAVRPLPAIEGKGGGYKPATHTGTDCVPGPASCCGQEYVWRLPCHPSELPCP